MECYEGATMIKTFRGIIADGAQDTIVLHTNDGSTGYRITKFELMTEQPGGLSVEHLVKIMKVSGSTIDNNVDFSDNTLVGMGIFQDDTGAENPVSMISIFDKEIFNQDIYLTHFENVGSASCNYYIELEQVKLDINSNTVATLKDMRNTASPRP